MEEHLGRKLEFNEVVHHINNKPKDNRIENLELRQRSDHSREHTIGRVVSEETRQKLKKIDNRPVGEQIKNHKLTEEQVREIKIKLLQGYGVRELGRMYNMNHTTISDIKNNKGWKHIQLSSLEIFNIINDTYED